MQLLGQAEVRLAYFFGRSGLGDAENFVWVFHWPSAKTNIDRSAWRSVTDFLPRQKKDARRPCSPPRGAAESFFDLDAFLSRAAKETRAFEEVGKCREASSNAMECNSGFACG